MESKLDIINQIKSELVFVAGKSSGPGGQHVNKTSTKVTLQWNLEKSAIDDDTKAIIRDKLASYVSKSDELSLSDQSTRSQLQNKRKVEHRFTDLVEKALKKPKKRYPTKRTRASVESRLKSKKKRTEIKKLRRNVKE